jgi:Glycosyltransferase family 87/WD40-like Beta Propeller Repeat
VRTSTGHSPSALGAEEGPDTLAPRTWTKQHLAECLLFLLVSLYLFGSTLPRAWRTLNTDFPNYYLTARLTHEGVDPARAYEWLWLQREKDHRNIDQRVVGLVPITPFSTLAMWPLVSLPPLQAKHVWLVFNLAVLLLLAFLLKDISGLSLLQIGCIIGLSFPLHRNLLYGQYYVLLLALLTAACWFAQRGRNYAAGALVGLGAALKIFPILLVLYFLRKKNWAALAACLLTGLVSALSSVAVFGWSMHRTYLSQVLPWTLRGEGLDPYNLTSSSLSSLLHRLFIYEPQWNLHPALHAPWLFATLHPLLQMALLAPAILLIDTKPSPPARIPLEWSALLFTILTLTPLPASYHFTVLIFPMAVVCGYLLRAQRWGLLSVVIGLYLAIGFPGWHTGPVDGWRPLLHVPRLYALILMTAVTLYLMKEGRALAGWRHERWWLAGGMAALILSISSGLRHQRGIFDDYAYRLPISPQILLASQPVSWAGGIRLIGLDQQGYRASMLSAASGNGSDTPGDPLKDQATDQLSHSAGGSYLWTETVRSHSLLLSSQSSSTPIVDAESPAVLPDGTTVAFLRAQRGRKQLFIRNLAHPGGPDRQLTPADATWNVEELAFAPSGSIVMSATHDGGNPGLYQVRRTGVIDPIPSGEARYPAISPDGRWLAFSGFAAGNWNLYLRELSTGETRRLSHVPCNQVDASWQPDSKTLLYASDCGRALWFTAICRRRVVP